MRSRKRSAPASFNARYSSRVLSPTESVTVSPSFFTSRTIAANRSAVNHGSSPDCITAVKYPYAFAFSAKATISSGESRYRCAFPLSLRRPQYRQFCRQYEENSINPRRCTSSPTNACLTRSAAAASASSAPASVSKAASSSGESRCVRSALSINASRVFSSIAPPSFPGEKSRNFYSCGE